MRAVTREGGRTKRTVLVLLVLAALTLALLLLGKDMLEDLVTVNPAPPEQAVAVQGIVALADGTPVPGAQVTVVWEEAPGGPARSQVRTDEKGRFQVTSAADAPTPGILEVTAQWGPLTTSVGHLLPAHVLHNLTLPSTFRLSGLVVHGPDRTGVEAASVTCGEVRSESTADGAFALEGIPAVALLAGDLVVHVEAKGFRPFEWPVAPDALPPTYGDLFFMLEPGP